MVFWRKGVKCSTVRKEFPSRKQEGIAIEGNVVAADSQGGGRVIDRRDLSGGLTATNTGVFLNLKIKCSIHHTLHTILQIRSRMYNIRACSVVWY